ncbi:MAG TPA: hypothetical protein VFS33_11940 [Gemmatimonadales bacterium]|nr:hypothetical protein [Gemmatimonadales bacterium]
MTVPVTAADPAPRPMRWPGLRVGLAVLVILLYAGATTMQWITRAVTARPRQGQDEISVYERRFEPLRTLLPARGTVGYLGHPDPTGPTPEAANAAALLHFRRYLLAHYALAPLLLIESTTPEFVVGNFEDGAVPPPPAGFHLVRDFGNGLVLYWRPNR